MGKRDAQSWAEYNAAKFDGGRRGRIPVKTPILPGEKPQPMQVEESFMDTIRMAAFKILKR